MDNVRRTCGWPQIGLVGAAMCTGLLCSVVEPVRADVVIAPTALTIAIPTGQTTAWGSITATNTGVAAETITYSDAIHCLQGLTPVTRTLAAGASSTFTIEGVCPATGTATLSGTGVPTVTIPVNITTAPAIGLNPTSLNFAGTVGGTTSAHAIAISNAGGGTLTWSASSNVTWLTLSPQSGTNTGTITATMNPTGLLLAGSYTATVTVTAVGATTKTIPVTLTMTSASSASGVTITPSAVAFTGTVGPGPLTLPVTFKNSGTSSVSFTWTDSIPWFHTGGAGAGGTLAPGQSLSYSMTANIAGMATGSYSGTATVTAGGITTHVPVTLTLTAATAATNTASLAWNANTDSDTAGYKVYEGTSSGHYAAPITTLSKTTTSYTVTGLQTGSTYFFTITAYDNVGNESLHSSEVSKTIQ